MATASSGKVLTTEGYMLCFVDDGCWAYFSSVDPEDVWGDDWNDAPHDCNAGTPYDRHEWKLVKVAFDGPLEVVGTKPRGTGVGRWGYLSADDINEGRAPWLVEIKWGQGDGDLPPLGVEVPAKTTLSDFRRLVREAGGQVYEARRR